MQHAEELPRRGGPPLRSDRRSTHRRSGCRPHPGSRPREASASFAPPCRRSPRAPQSRQRLSLCRRGSPARAPAGLPRPSRPDTHEQEAAAMTPSCQSTPGSAPRAPAWTTEISRPRANACGLPRRPANAARDPRRLLSRAGRFRLQLAFLDREMRRREGGRGPDGPLPRPGGSSPGAPTASPRGSPLRSARGPGGIPPTRSRDPAQGGSSP